MREDLLPTTLHGKVSKVIEESGEVLQTIGKYQRHGGRAVDPVTSIVYDNLADMKLELLDLQQSIKVLLEHLG